MNPLQTSIGTRRIHRSLAMDLRMFLQLLLAILVSVTLSVLMASNVVRGFTTTTNNKSIISGRVMSVFTRNVVPMKTRTTRSLTYLFEGVDNSNNIDDGNDDENENEKSESWDANIDYDKEWPGSNGSSSSGSSSGGDSSSSSSSSNSNSIPDPGTSWDALPNLLNSDILGNDATELLGIDLSLEPLSAKDADRLRTDARKIVEDAIDAGVNDIEDLKKKMNRELEASRRAVNLASELEAKRQSDMLMSKIDNLTGDFLKSSEKSRASTKMAAAASRAMEGSSATGNKAKGLEVGTWGILDGRTVVADDDITRCSGNGLLGSFGNAIREAARSNDAVVEEEEPVSSTVVQENRILIIADTNQDKLAKQLIPALLKGFEREEDNIPNLTIDVLSPTSNIPLGGNDAACVIFFFTGLNQPDTMKKILDRLLRKTLATGGGKLGTPPTQLVGISTLGTERFESFPYSVQNFLGGKLEKRRGIEEVLINAVRDRVTEPPLDYTIIKLKEGDFVSTVEDGKGSGQSETDFSLRPGDVSDDATSIETAVQVIVQAIAYQPPARNSTMSVSGSLRSSFLLEKDSMSLESQKQEDFWRETFTCLDGPELWRTTIYDSGIDSSSEGIDIANYYDRLVEYVQEWGNLFALSGKGLTTPVRAYDKGGLDPSSMITPVTSRNILYQEGVRLLFLPTNTGTNYMSRGEEARREKDRREGGDGSASSPATQRRISRDGGVDVVVEIVNSIDDDNNEDGLERRQLRVRARRTNYAGDAVIKELSETAIVKRLQDAVEVWKKDQSLI
jgi:hypothetical protein